MEHYFTPNLESYDQSFESGTIRYESPSNIALVKYWGKHPVQIPANPSISFTLDKCKTTTSLSFSKSNKFGFSITVSGKKKESFEPKITAFFQRVMVYLPFIETFYFEIETSNTFPHSSGIASSASGFSALALCLCHLEQKLNPNITNDELQKKASFIARLGSGSACRSIYGGLVSWGKSDIQSDCSDYWGTSIHNIHPVFKNYQDTILLVDKGTKEVSSSLGHSMMNEHPYAGARFKQANANILSLKSVLETGDVTAFVEIVETEALALHAMMMLSKPYYMLFKPNTVEIIHRVWQFRKRLNINLAITLDAGANVHLLYPASQKKDVLNLINTELVGFCENGQYICDNIGNGPLLLNEAYA